MRQLICSVLIVAGTALVAGAQTNSELGVSPTKPATGRFVETPRGFMVPYVARIPGTEVTYRMQPIPGGKVFVGSPASELGHQVEEGPQFEVTIEPFWMAEHEVTWAEYKTYMSLFDVLKELDVKQLRKAPDPMHAWIVTAPSSLYEPTFTFIKGAEPEQPAVTMSQFAARQYTKWLSGISGQFLRLPSEAEWEYACRAGTKTAYHFGDDPKLLGEYAWFFDNSGEKMNKVAQKKPNAWGLFDMHGNVGEWVLDQYLADGYQAHAGQTVTAAAAIAWPTKIYPRVVKGGGWDADSVHCRTAARRQSHDDDWRTNDPCLPQSPWWFTEEQALSVGFRFIRPLTPPATMAAKNKFWDADVQNTRDVVNLRIDDQGRGARMIADETLTTELKKLQPQR